MSTLFEIGLINAALVTILAIGIWLVTRVWRHPVLVHALWVVVLVKLVTPPMVNIPWRLADETTMSPMFAELQVDIVASHTEAAPKSARVAEPEETNAQAAIITSPLGATALVIPDEMIVPALTETSPSAPSWPTHSWFTTAAAVWLAGSGVFLAVTIIRLGRFHRALADAALAPHDLCELAERVAERFAVKRYRLRVTDGRLSPLVWPIGRPTIVLSRPLVAELSPEETQSLLAHEFAHLRRKDHWVRWLELVAVTIYWWHPVVWWARRMIRNSEEQACDAWVVWAFPDAAGRYAAALFTAVEFVTQSRPAAPLVASRLSAGPNLKERIENVMSGNCQRRLSLVHKLSLLIVALFALPLSLHVVRAEDESAKPRPEAEKPEPEVKIVEKLGIDPAPVPIAIPLPPTGIDQEIERQLRMPVKLQYVEAPLEEVVSQLENAVGVDIHFDMNALDEEGLPVDAPVTVQLKNQVSLRSALNLILKPLHLTFVIEDEVLKVTTEDRAAASRPQIADTIDAATANPFARSTVQSSARYPAAAAGREELDVLREHVRFLQAHFERVETRFKAGQPGGSADARDMVGYEMATAQAALAQEEGRIDEAAAHAAEAHKFAEQALKSVTAAYEAGRVTNDLVLQAANHASASRRRLNNLHERAASTAAQPQAKSTNTRHELREDALPSSRESEPPLSNHVWKKIVASKKQDYERMQALVEKNVISSTELERAKTDYEIHVARYEQAMRALKYNQLLVELAETEYQEAVANNKSVPNSVSDFELRKLQLKVQLAKAKLAELAE